MKKIVLGLGCYLLLMSCAFLLLAQAPPTPGDINSPANEVARLRLISTFQTALLAQTAKQQADAAFDTARQQFTDLADKTADELHYPHGTEFVINAAARTVQVKLPSPPPAPVKPEDKK